MRKTQKVISSFYEKSHVVIAVVGKISIKNRIVERFYLKPNNII